MIITKMSPEEFKNHIKNHQIFYCHQDTPAGIITLLATDLGIFQAVFEPEIKPEYILDNNINTERFILAGTDFQVKVWQETLKIESGKTLTYEQLAEFTGNKKAFRAVANALGKNKIAYFIPCHRVLRKDSSLGGYRWGLDKKAALLKKEGLI